jgi:hypothetical protein
MIWHQDIRNQLEWCGFSQLLDRLEKQPAVTLIRKGWDPIQQISSQEMQCPWYVFVGPFLSYDKI